MLKLVSGVPGERDARAEPQSSWLSAVRTLRPRLAGLSRALPLAFAGFVFLHFLGQAYRADTEGALPEAAFERAPWVVAALFSLFWLPFTVFGVNRLKNSLSLGRAHAPEGSERALRAVEPLALAVILVFGSVHGALMAWPLLSGALDAVDLKAQLVADLSSTWQGLPLHGLAYLCAVGAAAFFAARLALARVSPARPGLSRAIVGLSVLACLLGSYAVIRNGSGSLLP